MPTYVFKSTHLLTLTLTSLSNHTGDQSVLGKWSSGASVRISMWWFPDRNDRVALVGSHIQYHVEDVDMDETKILGLRG